MYIWIIIYRKRGSMNTATYIPYELQTKILYEPLVPSDLNLEDHEIMDIIHRMYDKAFFEFPS